MRIEGHPSLSLCLVSFVHSFRLFSSLFCDCEFAAIPPVLLRPYIPPSTTSGSNTPTLFSSTSPLVECCAGSFPLTSSSSLVVSVLTNSSPLAATHFPPQLDHLLVNQTDTDSTVTGQSTNNTNDMSALNSPPALSIDTTKRRPSLTVSPGPLSPAHKQVLGAKYPNSTAASTASFQHIKNKQPSVQQPHPSSTTSDSIHHAPHHNHSRSHVPMQMLQESKARSPDSAVATPLSNSRLHSSSSASALVTSPPSSKRSPTSGYEGSPDAEEDYLSNHRHSANWNRQSSNSNSSSKHAHTNSHSHSNSHSRHAAAHSVNSSITASSSAASPSMSGRGSRSSHSQLISPPSLASSRPSAAVPPPIQTPLSPTGSNSLGLMSPPLLRSASPTRTPTTSDHTHNHNRMQHQHPPLHSPPPAGATKPRLFLASPTSASTAMSSARGNRMDETRSGHDLQVVSQLIQQSKAKKSELNSQRESQHSSRDSQRESTYESSLSASASRHSTSRLQQSSPTVDSIHHSSSSAAASSFSSKSRPSQLRIDDSSNSLNHRPTSASSASSTSSRTSSSMFSPPASASSKPTPNYARGTFLASPAALGIGDFDDDGFPSYETEEEKKRKQKIDSRNRDSNQTSDGSSHPTRMIQHASPPSVNQSKGLSSRKSSGAAASPSDTLSKLTLVSSSGSGSMLLSSPESSGIEILETIPASLDAIRAYEEMAPNLIEQQQKEQEQQRQLSERRPRLKLRLSSSNASDAGPLPADPTNLNDNVGAAASTNFSPKNNNVFGLKLGGNSLTDSINSNASFDGTIQTIPLSMSGSGNWTSNSGRLSSDSLTSSGKLALANFQAAHAAALQNAKRPPKGFGSNKSGKHRLTDSYDVSQHGTLLLDGFEIGSTGIQRTPHVDHFEDEDDLENTFRRANLEKLKEATEAEEADSLSRASSIIGSSATSSAGSSIAFSLASNASFMPPPMNTIAPGGRRPSAVALKLLTSPVTAQHSHAPNSAAYPSSHPSLNISSSMSSSSAPPPQLSEHQSRPASLGVEFRLSDMVRIGDLGVGQNGTVVKACFLPTLRVVALKVTTVFEKDERHQLLKELKAFNSCNSPHILSFVGAAFMEGRITMALEFMNRGSLDQVVQKQGPLSVSMIRNISKQVLKGLRHMQQRKCLHRDIKPANVLLDNEGNCKISDFGLVKQLDATNALASTFVGTMLYLSPERITGDSFSYNSDVWSWGISVMYLATGKLDLPKDYWALLNYLKQPSPTLDRNQFPADLCDFVDQCLIKDAKQRPCAGDLLKHPFILATDPPNTPLHEIWPFSAGKEPNPRELDLLVQAVIDHYYFTPAQVTQGIHLQPQVPHKIQKKIFSLDAVDRDRIHSLAQQLAWLLEPLETEFIKRLVVKGQKLGGVAGEAIDGIHSMRGGVLASPSPTASSSSSSNRGSATVESDPTTVVRRPKILTRHKSVTLDEDPMFVGEFPPLPDHSGIKSEEMDQFSASVRRSLHLDRSFDPNQEGSNALEAIRNSISMGRTSASDQLQPSQPARISTSTTRLSHTFSPTKRADDSSSEDDFGHSPQAMRTNSFSSSSAPGTRRGSYSSSLRFDPNEKVRAFRIDPSNRSSTEQSDLNFNNNKGSELQRQSSQQSMSSSKRAMGEHLGAQLEDLAESDDDLL